ncbi:MAG: PD40 domain-containing protein [Gemmatimonadetes bacterium]|nr:PD40 domain-containing protein [Gemmatimonadota bacterium]
MIRRLLAAALVAAAPAAGLRAQPAPRSLPRPIPGDTAERHLRNVTQLTDGGENAEAYFSRDGKWLTFQSTRDGRTCDQQYVLRLSDARTTRISTGQGKTTCGWFLPGDRRLFFGSSHAVDTACAPRPDPSKGYVWRLDPFDIYTVGRDGKGLKRLTNYGVYTAEGILSPDGKRIVFTSLKDGDLDIYTMNVDGSNVKRLTTTPGYDGGPWWSPDGKQIVYRAWHYEPGDTALATYKALLDQRLVRPNKMELWVMNADGSNQRQVTRLGGANFGPSWAPGGRQIIFASNHRNPRSGNFDLYLVNLDGTGLEQVTTNKDFDGFPMFSPDGTRIVWASNRHDNRQGETNLFIADWVP